MIRSSSESALERILAAEALPSPSGVALELLRLADDENTDLDKIIQVVQSDPALSGRLLKLANSPFAGAPRRVGSVDVAVRMLGMRLVRNLALGLSLVSAPRPSGNEGFDYAAFWSHSLAWAVATRGLAVELGTVPPPDAFTLGLLAGVGQLALATVEGPSYVEAVEGVGDRDHADVLAAEHAAFGVNRYETAAALVRLWGLPEPFVLAIAKVGAEAPSSPRAAQLWDVIDCARYIADVVATPAPSKRQLDAVTEAVAARDVSAARLESLFDEASEQWQEAGVIFEVGTGDVCSLEELRESLAASAADEDAPPRAVRVLVVDDDLVSRKLLAAHVEQAGFSVEVAEDGIEALEVDRRFAPSIVITDWMMPNMDGLELCRRIRAQNPDNHVHVIVLSSATEDERVLQAFEVGADDFLTKPYRRAEIVARLRAAARIVRLEEDRAARVRETLRYSAALEQANERLRILATTDELTGLLNRREAMNRLEESWALSERNKTPMACIIGDIDHFKRINDTHGHDVGDVVLKAVAQKLRKTARTGEVVCRVGGEEFFVLCPSGGKRNAKVVAERLRAAIEALAIETRQGVLRVTMSFGVAERTRKTQRTQDLYTAADSALYEAKNAGRNRVKAASSF